jgi:hypothetical protein
VTAPDSVKNVANGLTDGSFVSDLTGSKLAKDLVADFLLTASAALLAVNISDLGGGLAAPTIVLTAVGGALIRVLYRATLKWATS